MKKKVLATAKILLVIILVVAMMPASVFGMGGDPNREETNLRFLPGWPSGPELNSRSAILIEMNSGEVLYTKNEDEKRYPASITKVMTALLVIEKCDMNEEVTFSHAAVTDLEEGGYNGYYKEGEVLTVEQCLYGLLLESVNECGYALAEHVAGSVSAFADMMNEKAVSLGCTNTHFNNPHGLNDENHYTTAHDMSKIFWACIQNEKFFEIDSTVKYKIDPTEKNPEGFYMTMHHKMMNSDSEYYNEAVKAGKTGYTSIAKNTLVTYAEKDGVELLCVVMKGDGGGAVYADTKALLNYGFKNFTLADMTSNAGNFVTGLNLGNSLPVKIAGNAKFFLPSGVESITISLEKKGAFDADGTVGNLIFSSGSDVLRSVPIVLDKEAIDAQNQTEPETTAAPESEGQSISPTPEASAEETGETASDGESIPTREESNGSGNTFLIVVVVVVATVLVLGGLYAVRRAKAEKNRRNRRKQIVEKFRQNRGE